ncbi:hypothetical protein [Kribbella sp. VKM Ac-2568]|uniref:hypothetical protein n=1 Tax=Kribbella sp. VKM Ac-2568 TaxID=2512219 RepID=UPI0010452C72|nr:hypothetical protein [Kribbella sp. VKM Ac-2568]TCM42506.1 hypothetical protein EV648_11036 [Kribbella sp. VKM Ac-2568]
MNIQELSALLQSKGVPADAYSIGSDSNESYCLLLEQGSWHVYYSERGNRNEERVYTSEADACQALLDMLLRDRTVQSYMRDN